MTRKTQEWLDKARQDLKAARTLAGTGDDDLLGIVGFLCQQSVEKTLKGLLADRGVAFPRTHDLSVLLTMCGQDDPMFLDFAEGVSSLYPFAVEVRYPSDLPRRPSRAEVEAHLDLAARLLDLVTTRTSGPDG